LFKFIQILDNSPQNHFVANIPVPQSHPAQFLWLSAMV